MRGRRILGAGTAVLLLAAAAMSGTAVTAGAGTKAAADGKVTFTVGITQDVDSLNPFTGIVSSAYEIYQLQYETLTDYGAKDFSAAAGAGRELGRLRRRAHLDLPPARRPDLVRRRAADGERRRLHVQPDPRRQVRADQLRQLRERA